MLQIMMKMKLTEFILAHSGTDHAPNDNNFNPSDDYNSNANGDAEDNKNPSDENYYNLGEEYNKPTNNEKSNPS